MVALRLIFVSVVLLISLQRPAEATTSAADVGERQVSAPGAASALEPSWLKWLRPGLVTFMILLVAIKVIFWPGQRATRPMTPEEIKQSQERVLDAVSKMRMWQAIGRNDGDAIREEMKLIELRNIRRQNEHE